MALDVAVGVARGFRPAEHEAATPVTSATRFAVFSASKPVVALAIAMLEDRGLPDVNAKGTGAAEGVDADNDGVIYGAEVGPKRMMRYTK